MISVYALSYELSSSKTLDFWGIIRYAFKCREGGAQVTNAYWKSNLPRLIKRLEFETGRKDWTQDAISEAAGVRQPTISEWMKPGEFKRLDASVVQKLLDFLNRHFVCEIDDLVTFIYEKDETVGQGAGLLVRVH
jgi:predicted XRE-type DNA-binding protein